MDGFLRPNVPVPSRAPQQPIERTVVVPSLPVAPPQVLASSAGAAAVAAPMPHRGVTRGDIDESLKAIDTERHRRSNKYDPYARARRRKRVKRIILTIVLVIVLTVAYFGVSALLAASKVLKGGVWAAVTQQGTPLQTDSYGRTNILIFGTSEDDPGHDGANLTDSIMILSVDQKNKKADMVSIPRDLWVQYDKSCTIGYAGKINATFECGLENSNNNETAAAEQFMNKVDDVMGISLQYYAHVNYTVVKDAVNAVGGVDVNIVGDGHPGIYDTNFDWNCPGGRPYSCKNVYYPTDGTYHLDGTEALYLARARADGGAYSYKDFGLSRGNFDREQNQQKILKALQAKAQSAGTLSNPIKVLDLINTLGNNIHTSFETKEITTLIGLAKDIKTDNIVSHDIDSGSGALVTTGTGPDGSSIVKPIDGLLDYSGLQGYMKALLSGDASATEDATVAVYNGSQLTGVAGTTSTMLKNAGFRITNVNDATSEYAAKYTLYDQSKGAKPATLTKLEKQLGVKPTAGTPKGIDSTADFVVVVGDGISGTSSSATGTSSGASQ